MDPYRVTNQQIEEAAERRQELADFALGTTSELASWSPAGDVQDASSFVFGKDVITGEKFGIGNRIATGLGAAPIPLVTGKRLRQLRRFVMNLAPQTHHVLSNKHRSRWTPLFREITDDYDLSLDGSWNKIEIPHRGRHPNEYHEWVHERIQAIDRIAQGDRDTFLRLFDEEVVQVVQDTPEMLRREYWR